MDPQIISAVIVSVATVAAVVIGWWLHERKNHAKYFGRKGAPETTAIELPHKTTNRGQLKSRACEHQVATPTSNLSKIKVNEIVDSINSAPPFQKEQTAKNFSGIRVRWVGYLKEASEDPRDKDSVRVNLTINQDTLIGYSFWFTEKVANFPEVRTLKETLNKPAPQHQLFEK
ncbi:hypothetical protein [Alkalilimnicola sp. S0819]|uniref:hypothetical protein n=1 Tax=Alkalilimnicola sp. S0819 TaxID=2613922 RepID=UPI0012613DC7|nr:hypothetical protein [Alkalilimnicola sp. S0819]KAB7619453.1 hypothetical protein F3N43_13725 [Alkalilimnicola sp. S0819]MPQ17696.1 hypothetical protein [Alkalilimnicola sp. S0819]